MTAAEHIRVLALAWTNLERTQRRSLFRIAERLDQEEANRRAEYQRLLQLDQGERP